MKKIDRKILIPLAAIGLGCTMSSVCAESAGAWVIETQSDWSAALAEQTDVELNDGQLAPTQKQASFSSVIQSFKQKRKLDSIEFAQSTVWQNWEPIKFTQPNMTNAPIAISCGPNDYWILGNYRTFENMSKLLDRQRLHYERRNKGGEPFVPPYNIVDFVPETVTLEGYDVPLETTPYPNQYRLKNPHVDYKVGGYHGWHSRDMVNWVHYGSMGRAGMATTAEYVDGELYLYYDQPNDRDPHLIINRDMKGGGPAEMMGMVFDAPWAGSDSVVIRDLEGKFHMISENWGPVDASERSWDSPLATHVVSPDGINDFQVVGHAVDARTEPTGVMATFKHPHWGDDNVVEYEVHEPEQEAYGDWAAIAIGGQYYLFSDYDPAGGHNMSVGIFTSSSIDEPFTWCGNLGDGHPDPDIMFAEGRFYLATQTKSDFVSPGPWVETVEARVGVDTTGDGEINEWSDWQETSEQYDYIPGFAKQVAKTPAKLDLSNLPAGYGFQFEVRMTDTTENESKPILDKVVLSYAKENAQ